MFRTTSTVPKIPSNHKSEDRLEIHTWCFDEGSVFIYFSYSKKQHCFYNISSKIISCSDNTLQILLWKVPSEQQLTVIFFACHCENICCFQRQSLLPFWVVGYKDLKQTSVPRYKLMKYIPRLLCLCYIHDQLESSRVWWSWICGGSNAEK